MSINWIEAIDACSTAALASGALVPVQAEQVEMEDAGMRFIVRWVSSLAAKDASRSAAPAQADAAGDRAGKAEGVQGGVVNDKVTKDDRTVAIPGGPRDPNFNPFLNPDPALTVGRVGDAHVAILNKFPLCARHLVLARREFEEQLRPLARSDFAALAELMGEAGGTSSFTAVAVVPSPMVISRRLITTIATTFRPVVQLRTCALSREPRTLVMPMMRMRSSGIARVIQGSRVTSWPM